MRLAVLCEGKKLEHVGFFVKLPKALANQFPKGVDKDGDSSAPHVTILYVGELDSGDVKKLKEVGKEVVSGFEVEKCKLNGLGWFEGDKWVAHCKVKGEVLGKLNKALWDAVEEKGIKVDHKWPVYKPHVTLAYVDEKKWDGVVPDGEWDVGEVELWVGDGKCAGKFKLKV